MKIKKITSLLLTLIMMATLCVTAIPTASAATNEVSLIYSGTDMAGGGGFNTQTSILGYIEVENIAYNKNITVYYSANGGQWKETAATYYKQTWGNKEAWYFRTPYFTCNNTESDNILFYIKYEVNGNTYYDNNNGNNYKVNPSGVFTIGNCGFKVNKYYQNNQNSFWANLNISNIAYEKDVKIRYTTDGWKTYKEANASYSKYLYNGVEEWYFEANDLPDNWDTVEFVAYYTVNGTVYYDDNFGDKYSIKNFN